MVTPHSSHFRIANYGSFFGGLVAHIKSFVDYKEFYSLDVLGNSLGGHLAILYTLKYPEEVRSLTLTGSSGLFESAMGTTFPKGGDYDFIKIKQSLHSITCRGR